MYQKDMTEKEFIALAKESGITVRLIDTDYGCSMYVFPEHYLSDEFVDLGRAVTLPNAEAYFKGFLAGYGLARKECVKNVEPAV